MTEHSTPPETDTASGPESVTAIGEAGNTAGDGATRGSHPTRTSSRVGIALTLSFVGLIVWQFPPARIPVIVGMVGGFLLATGLWFVGRETGPQMAFLTGLLAVPVALGLAGGPVLMVLELFDEIFPVPDSALLSLGSLIIVGYVGVVIGCSLVAFGVLAGKLGLGTATSLRRFSDDVFVAGIPPAFVGIVFVMGVLVTGDGQPVGLLVNGLSLIGEVFLGTDPASANLGSFLLVVALAAGGVALSISRLPVRELLVEQYEPATLDRRLDRLRVGFLATFVTAGALGGLFFALETIDETILADALGEPATSLVRVLTASVPLRFVLFVVGILTLAGAVAGVALRRYARRSSAVLPRRLGALAAGLVVTVLAILVAEMVYSTVVAAIVAELPSMLAPEFDSRATEIADRFGEPTLIVILTGTLVGLAGFFVLGLRFLLAVDLLRAETPGFSLASSGIFLATVFGAIIGLSPVFVFLGVAGALIVWDVGRYGTTLGREVGAGVASRRPELIHATGSILVGGIGVLVALGAVMLLEWEMTGADGGTILALVSILVGLLALIEALRLS